MSAPVTYFCHFFFFQAEDGIRDGHVTGVQTCALPILRPGHHYDERANPESTADDEKSVRARVGRDRVVRAGPDLLGGRPTRPGVTGPRGAQATDRAQATEDRKSTRLNSSHVAISYAVFCL